MCRRVTCMRCDKPTFAGCGAHVEQVLRDVPRADRCRCHEAPTPRSEPHREGSSATPATAPKRA